MVEMTVSVYCHNGLETISLDKLCEHAVLASNHITSINDNTLLGVIPRNVCILSEWVKNQSFNLHNTLSFYSISALSVICCTPFVAVEKTCNTR